jgi:stearoyl-CoA desaturase (delta-9 desaturase)
LKALAAAGLVWDLRSPPAPVVRSEQRLRRAVVERAAGQLAASFQVEHIAVQLHALLAEKRASLNTSIDELQDELAGVMDSWSHQLDETLETARHELDEFIRTVHLPDLPTMTDLRSRAADMFADTPSMNDIVERARQILIDGVLEELLGREVALVPARA